MPSNAARVVFQPDSHYFFRFFDLTLEGKELVEIFQTSNPRKTYVCVYRGIGDEDWYQVNRYGEPKLLKNPPKIST